MITVQNDRGWKDSFSISQKEKIDYIQSHHFDGYLELKASGSDLIAVLNAIVGIPKPYNINTVNSFTWYGNIAKTILANL